MSTEPSQLRYAIISWSVSADGSFFVEFTVNEQGTDSFDRYEVTIPYLGEDAFRFMDKVRQYMVGHVEYLNNLSLIKRRLTNYRFTEPKIN